MGGTVAHESRDTTTVIIIAPSRAFFGSLFIISLSGVCVILYGSCSITDYSFLQNHLPWDLSNQLPDRNVIIGLMVYFIPQSCHDT